MAWSGVITDVGAALLETWAAGSSTLTILSADAGEGYVASGSAKAQTALVSEKQTASIVSSAASAGGQRLKLQLSPPQTGYTLNQLGIWAKVGTGSSTLLALYQNPDGVAIPAASVNPDFVYTFYATLTMSNSGTISVTVDSSAVVSQSTMESYVASAIAAALPSASTSTPAMDGTGSAGSSTAWARGDHVHPTDTGRQAKIMASGILKGDGNGGVSAATAGTDYQAPLTGGTDYARPSDLPSPSSASPKQDAATASAGTSADYARGDHVHPRPYQYSTTDLTAGTSSLTTGTLYFVYE